MTKRYPLGGAFGSGDSSDAGDFEGIAFGIFEAADGGYHAGLHFYEGVGFGGAGADLLGGDVDHLHFAVFAVVGEFWHQDTQEKELTQSSLSAQRSQRKGVKLRPCGAGLGRFLRHLFGCGLPRLPGSSLRALVLRCRRSLATPATLLQVLCRAIRHAREENASSQVFRSVLPRVALRLKVNRAQLPR